MTIRDLAHPPLSVSEFGKKTAPELIDALYELLVLCITNKYVEL